MSNSVDPDQGRRSVGPGLDSDCLHVNSLNISEEMLGASQKLSLTDGQTDGLTGKKTDRPQADRYVFDPCWFWG